jgi:hypothetical protein
MDKPSNVGLVTDLPAEPPVSLPASKIRVLVMSEKANVVMARYKPLSRSEGMPTSKLTAAGTKPAASSTGSRPQPWSVDKMAVV